MLLTFIIFSKTANGIRQGYIVCAKLFFEVFTQSYKEDRATTKKIWSNNLMDSW
jgi:hypothetical protein